MTVLPKHPVSPSGYLQQEREALEKSEFFEGEVFLMAGASQNHNRINENLSGEVYAFLKDSPCQSFSRDMRLHIPVNTLFTYPDLMVICGKPEVLDIEEDTLLNPILIAEVLSKSTANYDRGAKFELYRQIPSFKEYVLIDSRRVKAEIWFKNEADTWMLAQETADPADALHFQTIRLHLNLQDIYAGTLL